MKTSNPILRFLAGFQFIVIGMRYLSHNNSLKKWALMPFLLAGIVFVAGIWGAIAWLPEISRYFSDRFLNFGPGSSSVLSIILLFIFAVLFVILHFYLVYLFASLISAPFHAVLAERVLKLQGQKNVESFRLSQIVVSILKTFLFATIGISLVLGSFFIPGLNVLSAFALFFMIAYDSADYSLEALGYSFTERLNFVKAHMAEFCGMASFVGLTLFVPGLILLLMPAAVIGSTLLVFQLHRPSQEVS